MRLTNLFKRNEPDEQDVRVIRMHANAEFQRQRESDPMLQYWNKDVRWCVLQANMGPGGEYFSGIELVAMWAREPEPVETLHVFTTHAPQMRYPSSEYRLIAIGLSAESAGRLAALRNKEVLGE
jgi:hypothetical protein